MTHHTTPPVERSSRRDRSGSLSEAKPSCGLKQRAAGSVESIPHRELLYLGGGGGSMAPSSRPLPMPRGTPPEGTVSESAALHDHRRFRCQRISPPGGGVPIAGQECELRR